MRRASGPPVVCPASTPPTIRVIALDLQCGCRCLTGLSARKLSIEIRRR